ncbi:response regulator transcription factor [Abyssicoccus albus]|uniref:Two-component system response regulator protein BraR/BceR n=1 Tax=Abyssicoccus albus TaxID=1817405 RepID=A0A3N5BGV4_9BACL|nr:response regulator transcription factor [Abyssicoccus albus]RPF56773.1 two-component system response regulator protein BraR/BceR [Abyssicoccus albus]
MKVMIVEDDKLIRESISQELLSWGFEVNASRHFDQVLLEFLDVKPELVLLDVNLPIFNGFHWCQEIRKHSQVPIIFISSRTDSMDQVMAMQMGADDYIVKPFNMMILTSKIQALLRRTYDFNLEDHQRLIVGNIELFVERAELHVDDVAVELTQTELLILNKLFRQKNNYVSRDELIEECWSSSNYIDDNTLAVNMTRLRKKLAKVDCVDFIETKKNVGYRVVE